MSGVDVCPVQYSREMLHEAAIAHNTFMLKIVNGAPVCMCCNRSSSEHPSVPQRKDNAGTNEHARHTHQQQKASTSIDQRSSHTVSTSSICGLYAIECMIVGCGRVVLTTYTFDVCAIDWRNIRSFPLSFTPLFFSSFLVSSLVTAAEDEWSHHR